MDRRFDPRLPADLPVTILRLDDEMKIAGSLVDISESGICALLSEHVPPGTLVQVGILEVGLYGEIVYSHEENGGFRTGVFVEQVLLETSNVSRVVQSYLDTSTASAGYRTMADASEPLL